MSFLLLLFGLIFGGPAHATRVDRVDASSDRIVIRFDGAVSQASSFLLDGPRRIAVDVAEAQPGRTADTSGLVDGVRQGWRKDGARIVFDLAAPALVSRGDFSADGHTLTLSLAPATADAFASAAGGTRMRFAAATDTDDTPARAKRVVMAVPSAKDGPPLPRVYGADDSRPLVVIDPGHGGHDPGAIAADTGLREKDVTLKIAKAIRDELVKSGRVRVALTRDDDRYLILRERFGIARKLGASLFISIHCDSATSDDATGASVYTLSEVASDKEAARLAARENKSDIIAGVNLANASADISSILIDLTQRETMNSSAGFARLLGREAKPLVPMKATFHRMASLMVLKAPDMPSILFETGYISNPQDAAFLDSKDGEARIATGVSRAVDVFFARRLASRD